jgi:hypothetical protein
METPGKEVCRCYYAVENGAIFSADRTVNTKLGLFSFFKRYEKP